MSQQQRNVQSRKNQSGQSQNTQQPLAAVPNENINNETSESWESNWPALATVEEGKHIKQAHRSRKYSSGKEKRETQVNGSYNDDDSQKENREPSTAQATEAKPKSKKRQNWKKIEFATPKYDRSRDVRHNDGGQYRSSGNSRGRPGHGERGSTAGASRYPQRSRFQEDCSAVIPVPPPPSVQDSRVDAIRRQIEYYFSEANLRSDDYMRGKMDPEGFIPISIISSFYRVRALTDDVRRVIEAMRKSDHLELKEDIWVRTAVEPEKWPSTNDASHNSGSPELPSAMGLPAISSRILYSNLNPEAPEFVPRDNPQKPP